MNELLQLTVPFPVFIASLIGILAIACFAYYINNDWYKHANKLIEDNLEEKNMLNNDWAEFCKNEISKACEEGVSKGFDAGVEYANSQKSEYSQDGLLNLEK